MAHTSGSIINSSGLTVNDLRQKIYNSFKERGLLDSLKTQLRNMLVDELHKTSVIVDKSLPSKEESPDCAYLHASNMLIVDHLNKCHYDYTLSMFLPESRIKNKQVIKKKDVVDLLKISHHSKIYRSLMFSEDKSCLAQLLQSLIVVENMYQEATCQTESTSLIIIPTSSLEEKLHSVDDLYSSLKLEYKRSCHLTSEERLLSYKKEIEEQSRKQVSLELSRYKEVELAKIKLEEQENYHQKLNQMRKELEQAYKIKSDGLMEREKNSIEQLQRQQSLIEKDTYNQRQQVLHEIQILQQKQKEVRTEQDVYTKKHMLEEERLRAFEQQVKDKETRLNQALLNMEQNIEDQIRKQRLEQEQQYLSRLRDLELREIKIKESTQKADEDQKTILALRNEINTKQKKIEELEAALQQAHLDLISVSRRTDFMNEKLREMVDYKSVKEEAAVLKNELETTKQLLAENKHEYNVMKIKHEEQLKLMTEKVIKVSPELMVLTRELERVKQEVQQEQRVSMIQKEQLEIRLQKEREHNREIFHKYNDQSKVIKQLQELYNSLKGISPSPSILQDINISDSKMITKVENFEKFKLSHRLEDNFYFTKPSALDQKEFSEENWRTIKDVSSDFLYGSKERIKALGDEALTLEKTYQDLRNKLLSTHLLSPVKNTHVLSSKEFAPDRNTFTSSSYKMDSKTDYSKSVLFNIPETTQEIAKPTNKYSTPTKNKERNQLSVNIPSLKDIKEQNLSEPSSGLSSLSVSEIIQVTQQPINPTPFSPQIALPDSSHMVSKVKQALPFSLQSLDSTHYPKQRTPQSMASPIHSPKSITRSDTFVLIEDQIVKNIDLTAQSPEAPSTSPIATILDENVSALPAVSLDTMWKSETIKDPAPAVHQIAEAIVLSPDNEPKSEENSDHANEISKPEVISVNEKEELEDRKYIPEKKEANSSESDKSVEKSSDNINPLMKTYMERILQKHQKELEQKKSEDEEKSIPTASDISAAGDKSQASDIFTWD